MQILIVLFAVISLFAPPSSSPHEPTSPPAKEQPKKKDPPKKKLTDKQIKRILIKESIDSYPGNCPCPYNTASNGSRCGGRSAYSRGGGYEPLCYAKDVSAEMVANYREAHGE